MFRGPHSSQHGIGVNQQALAFGGEPDPARQPIEQRGADGLLQRRNVPRHRRLRVAKGLPSRRQRTTRRNLAKYLQPRDVNGLHDILLFLYPCTFRMPPHQHMHFSSDHISHKFA
jgi:hypothetical protein